MKLTILRTAEFNEWFAGVDKTTRFRVEARLERIATEGHFGLVNRFEGITELKWTSGLRIYSAVREPNVIVLLGGTKNGQEKDIRRAKRILREINEAQN